MEIPINFYFEYSGWPNYQGHVYIVKYLLYLIFQYNENSIFIRHVIGFFFLFWNQFIDFCQKFTLESYFYPKEDDVGQAKILQV